MQFNHKELLKAMGLGIGNFIVIDGDSFVYEIVYDEVKNEIVLVSRHFRLPLTKLVGQQYKILYYFIMSEDEKTFLRNMDKFSRIKRDMGGNLYIRETDGHWLNFPFPHLFKFVQNETEMMLDELRAWKLKEIVDEKN